MKNQNLIPFDASKLAHEVSYQTSRSGGKGGQHVNKVSSRVALRFDVAASTILTESQKEIILKKLSSRIHSDGILQIVSQEARSQLMNKKLAKEKLISLLIKCLKPSRKRIAMKIPESMKEERLKDKKMNAEKKKHRKDSGLNEPA